MTYAFTTNELSFKYQNDTVLDRLNLLVPENSIYGYIGKNGAGKTTTIKLLLGLLDAPTGSISFMGDIMGRSNREEILSKIGNLVESPCYYSELSGYENLKYLDYIFKFGEDRISYILDIIGLSRYRNKRVKTYSTGMKQRLGIGMAIFHDPKILILDEPMNGLDPEGVYEMRELMISLQKEGKTIFLSSHILSEMEKTCTHIGLLHNGRLLFQGSMGDIIQKHPAGLESAFLHFTSS
jgi:ABC-2 type transport system ATP-binding protein